MDTKAVYDINLSQWLTRPEYVYLIIDFIKLAVIQIVLQSLLASTFENTTNDISSFANILILMLYLFLALAFYWLVVYKMINIY